MAVANTKSQALQNMDNLNPPMLAGVSAGGRLRAAIATVATTTSDSANSVYRFVRVPSNAIIKSIKVYNGDLDSGTSAVFTLGVLKTLADGGDVVATGSASVYATSMAAMQSANTTGTEYRFNTLALTTAEDPIWKNAGLAAESVGAVYDLCITATTVTGLQGNSIVMDVTYLIP